MAYANYIAAVEWADIASLRQGSSASIVPHSIAVVSHLYAYAVKRQPVSGCLGKILDKGEVLSASYWHPLRVPVVHSPEAVRALTADLRAALGGVDANQEEDALDHDITEILRILDDAAETNRAVLSVLEPPADEERAQKVSCPFEKPETLPVSWGQLTRTMKRFSKRR